MAIATRKHSHANAELLDTYAQTEAALADAVTKKHANTLDHASTNDPSTGEKAALPGTSGTPADANRYVTNADSRNTDAWTPTAHNQDASTINAGTLDGDRLPVLSATKKGGAPATGTPSGKFLKDDGTWAAPTASVAIQQTEIDFGMVPVAEASFIVTDAAVSPSSRIIGSIAYVAPTGKDLDEMEMDALDLKFAPGSGQLTIWARGLDGYIADKFKVNYLVG